MHSKYRKPGYLERAARLEVERSDYHKNKPADAKHPQRDVPPAPGFTEQYQRFHRVWAEILADALAELSDDLRVPADPRGLALAVLKGYEEGRKRWCPEALLKAVKE